MRVIAGTARSMPLSTPKGNDTRPTTDRIKETLFNMLQSYIPDCVFVDVCSGSGAIGIEALSRGASHAYFIDRDQACIQCIKNNLSFTKLDQRSTILKQDACTALNMIHEKAVDVVFADPPYALPQLPELPDIVLSRNLLKEGGLFVLEHGKTNNFSQHPRFVEHRAYGSVNFSFFQ